MELVTMTKTKIFIAVAIMNLIIFAGIFNELGDSKDDVDTSTIITAKLIINYTNAGDNDTKIFESVTTSESTVFGLLMAVSIEEEYQVKTENSGEGLTVTNIIIPNCEECKEEEDFSWQYTINGFYSDIAANRNIIKNNDVIEWIYTDEI